MAISRQDIWKLVSNVLKIISIIDQNISNMNTVISLHYCKIELGNAYIKKYFISYVVNQL
jgi:hypothetical protein